MIKVSSEGHGFYCDPFTVWRSVYLPEREFTVNFDMKTFFVDDLKKSTSLKETIISIR